MRAVIGSIFLCVIGLFFSSLVLAGESMTCPNLQDPNVSLEGWVEFNPVDKSQFKKVVLATTGVGCEYKDGGLLMKIGVQYVPDEPDQPYWHRTGGGVDSVYCTESLFICSFH